MGRVPLEVNEVTSVSPFCDRVFQPDVLIQAVREFHSPAASYFIEQNDLGTRTVEHLLAPVVTQTNCFSGSLLCISAHQDILHCLVQNSHPRTVGDFVLGRTVFVV